MALTPLDDLVALLRRDPATTVIATDFDGTLARIVEDPDSSRPIEGAGAVLRELAGRYGAVAVLSGRPVGFLQHWLPSEIELHGLYGLETGACGVRRDHESAGAWREAVADVVAASRAWAPAGVLVEPKGLSLTLHYRTRPELGDDVLAFAEVQSARAGLALRPARKSVELHPPVAVDKGTVLGELADGMEAACFVGDDAGDLPAFTALDRLGDAGVSTARIAVTSPEAPPELLARADAILDGPPAVLDFLRRL